MPANHILRTNPMRAAKLTSVAGWERTNACQPFLFTFPQLIRSTAFDSHMW